MVKVQLVGLDKAADVLERALKIRDPELWQTRRENYHTARRDAAKKYGVPLNRITRDPKKLGIQGWHSNAGYSFREMAPLLHRTGLGT